MSKWVDRSKYEEFVKKKKEEAVEQPSGMPGGGFLRWRNPQMGDQENPKTYKLRILPDKNGNFYKKYFYHFFKQGDKSNYIKCPKTENMENYCPWCHARQILYKGNASDKEKASNYNRNERFVANVYIISDPRDADQSDDSYKHSGKVKLYEFPRTIESKIKNEITDPEQGYGLAIFDPEEGHDFIIKVKAKKPDKNGKVWPDYSDTMFARRPSAIAESEEEIKQIMESTFDLDDYVNRLGISWDDHKKLLKQEMLWEDVKHDFVRLTEVEDDASTSATEKMDDLPFDGPAQEQSESTSSSESESSSEESGDYDEEELLEELKNM